MAARNTSHSGVPHRYVIRRNVQEARMRRILGALACVAVVAAPVFGQSAAPAPSFDIADVHAGSRNPGVGMTGGQLRDGRYELHNATMVDLIRTAYSVDAERVLGGPSWLELDKFTVIAKA